MKIDALTIGAVGFAAFAAWYVLKPKNISTAPTESDADAAFGMLTSQRQAVGENLWQNVDWMGANLSAMGGGQGLRPSSGFWA